jgi:hypothetical protein
MQVIRSIFGESEPRTGKLTLSEKTSKKMQATGLDIETLKDVYRYGYEIKDNIIVRDYSAYMVGIIIRPDVSTDIDGRFLVSNCWKRSCYKGLL